MVFLTAVIKHVISSFAECTLGFTIAVFLVEELGIIGYFRKED